jgi:hypothetical protein
LLGYGFTAELRRCIAFKRGVNTAVVVIFPERFKRSLQINRIPEQSAVEKLATNGPDQTLDEWGVWSYQGLSGFPNGILNHFTLMK